MKEEKKVAQLYGYNVCSSTETLCLQAKEQFGKSTPE